MSLSHNEVVRLQVLANQLRSPRRMHVMTQLRWATELEVIVRRERRELNKERTGQNARVRDPGTEVDDVTHRVVSLGVGNRDLWDVHGSGATTAS